jgi:hypothetical protein
LPIKLIKSQKEGIISCNFHFIFKNNIKSTHDYSIELNKINHQNWLPQAKLLISKTADNNYVKFDILKQGQVQVPQSLNFDSYEIYCGQEIHQKNYTHNLFLDNIDQKQLFNSLMQQNKNWLKVNCQLFIYSKNQIMAWTPPFYLLNPNFNFQANIQLAKSQNKEILFVTLVNPTHQNVFLRLNTKSLNQSFQLLEGFNVYTSGFSDIKKYEKPAYRSLWFSSHRISKVVFKPNSNKSKPIKIDNDFTYYKLNKKSKITFVLMAEREMLCNSIDVQYSKLFNKKHFHIEITEKPDPIVAPLDSLQMDLNKPIVKIGSFSRTDSSKTRKYIYGYGSPYPSYRLDSIKNKKVKANIIQSILKNNLDYFDCTKSTLPTSY